MRAVCFFGWKHPVNVLSIIRTADGFGFNEVILTGRKKISLADYPTAMAEYENLQLRIITFNEPNQCIDYIKSTYSPVCFELHKRAIPIYQYEWPHNPCIIVGHEREGVPQRLLDISDIVFIPMANFIKCLNVGCCASIAMYDYVQKLQTRTGG